MRISDEYLDELRQRNDIVDVVSSYVQLRGGGRYSTGLCPFHNERTPSFTVYSDTQSFYCFGCSKGGDVITFIRDIENLDYREAVRFLAERCGMPLPQEGFDDSMAKLRRQILEANREAGRFYHAALFRPEGKAGLDYFRRRGLTDATLRHFGLGYAPDRWDALLKHLRAKGYSDSVLLAADLAKHTKNGGVIDAFRNRVMFPIIDVRGNLIAFGGRVLDDSKPKYLNTSDTPVYKKSHGVFALNFAKVKNPGRLILCEGYMDVIAYHQAGFTEAVAGLGTAFTREQAKLLSGYCEEIILSYDADGPGQTACEKAIDLLGETELRVRVALLDGGKDPDEIIRTQGVEKMRAILDGAVSAQEFRLKRATGGVDQSTDQGRVDYLHKACEVIADMRDPIGQDVYISRLAQETGVSREAIKAQVEQLRRRRKRNRERQQAAQAANFSTDRADAARLRQLAAVRAEETLIGILMREPGFYKRLRGRVKPEWFVNDADRVIWDRMTARFEAGQEVNLSLLGQDLTAEELARLSRLTADRAKLSNTPEECADAAAVMEREYDKRQRETLDLSSLSAEEFRKLFVDPDKRSSS